MLVLLLALLPMSAFAQGYIGGVVGRADLDMDDFDDPTTFSVFGGIKFGKFMAVEASYVDFSEVDDDIAPVWTIDSNGFDISVLTTWPIAEKFELFAKVGATTWQAELTEAGYGKIDDDDGTDVSCGAGVAFNFTENFSVPAQFVRVNDIDVDNMSVGLKFSL